MRRRGVILGGLCGLATVRAQARSRGVFQEQGLAILGHDPVAYRIEGRAIPGRDDLVLRWRGALWRFATEANCMHFEMDPLRHAPAYGGYCAMAMTRGRVVASDPVAFAIHADRLFLANSPDALAMWLTDPAAHIARADQHWPAALDG